jgi:indolepyruvate ferredoxin oxidoreductase
MAGSARPTASLTFSYGKADLLIGLDPLEAVRAIDSKSVWRVASPDRTVAVINTDWTPTIRTLMGRDNFRVDELEALLKTATRGEQYFSARITSLCERIFGTKLYANITMLGAAYQRGLIPVSLEAMKDGIRRTIRADFKKNLRAFDIGRKLVSHPELFTEPRVGLASSQSDRQDADPTSLARTVRERRPI